MECRQKRIVIEKRLGLVGSALSGLWTSWPALRRQETSQCSTTILSTTTQSSTLAELVPRNALALSGLANFKLGGRRVAIPACELASIRLQIEGSQSTDNFLWGLSWHQNAHRRAFRSDGVGGERKTTPNATHLHGTIIFWKQNVRMPLYERLNDNDLAPQARFELATLRLASEPPI